MKVDDAVETIAKFFNDLIGAWVPGSVLATGLAIMHLGPDYMRSLAKLGEGGGLALILAGLLFALGHALLAIHENGVKILLKYMKLSKGYNESEAQGRHSYEWFAEIVNAQKGANPSVWEFHDLRSVALSVSSEAAAIGRRFMFISLLCSGVGTALIILGFDFLVCLFFQPDLLYGYDQAPSWFVQAILLFGTALLLFKQSDEFHARAMNTPFAAAVAELKLRK
ncbi:TPA: hypothetical protein SMS45_000354 [Pseudomonas aeruginosa]|uniref:hypothetical protein n=1 Tax=Pseudomonas aeruginosa TaxID=287 RepID=UPI001CBF93FB|nr:hypothetical protein [Pseudomonas aeruginosa]HBP6280116.1 hypothetical protein [Pseudomonas aeruginosa]HCL4344343.1 hypothetical protein [Pseudomonas aeruginosa]HEK2085056.1 hypothetical protein [Pseudomonas aeruginosa]